MKFLIDAQLPRRLAFQLQAAGYDAVHTRDLPEGNRTPDAEIIRISLAEKRVVITKDADFVTTFLLRQQPYKLLLISTGNITNNQLEYLVFTNLTALISMLEANNFVEIDQHLILVHM